MAGRRHVLGGLAYFNDFDANPNRLLARQPAAVRALRWLSPEQKPRGHKPGHRVLAENRDAEAMANFKRRLQLYPNERGL